MKSFVAILALVAVAAADVAHLVRSPEADAVVVKQEQDVFPDQYQYGYETSNGIAGQESGVLDNVGKEDSAIVVQGRHAYTSPEGKLIVITYTADRNGYHPQGDHLPTPPAPVPIPEYIVRALEYIGTHPPKEEAIKKF